MKEERFILECYRVTLTGDVGDVDVPNVDLIGPDEMARMVFEVGLTSWLREKVS